MLFIIINNSNLSSIFTILVVFSEHLYPCSMSLCYYKTSFSIQFSDQLTFIVAIDFLAI